jgi:hypothetical protein
MNTEAGLPTPPPLPGRAPEPQQKVLQFVLAGAILVLIVVSIILALVVWKYGFSNQEPVQVSPPPDKNVAAVAASNAPVLQIQSRSFNILRGDHLIIVGSAEVQRRDGYLAVSDAPDLRIQDALTISAWFNAPSYEQPMTIAGRAQNGPPWRYPFLSWLVRINTESLMEIDVGHNQSYAPSGWNIPPLLPNQWYFVTMTFDGQTKKLFLNGTQITSLDSGSPNSQSGIYYAPGRAILIGADESEAPVGDRFRGMIDDVRIYDRALSEEEVQRVFQEGVRRLPLRR